jgi:DNA-binding response OmpR family regulator
MEIETEPQVSRDLASSRLASSACIALAEDDAEMRRLVAEALRADGYQVIELADGAQLLVRIARQYRIRNPDEKIDLIISDIRMPVITGLAILKGLRDAHCKTPVILMTAFGDDVARRAALELDAALFNKPFKMGQLRELVRKLLS